MIIPYSMKELSLPEGVYIPTLAQSVVRDTTHGLHSVNYPATYPHVSTLQATTRLEVLTLLDLEPRLTVTFADFDVNGDDGCCLDFVVLRDGSGTQIASLVGNDGLGNSYTSTDGVMDIYTYFQTPSGRGFKIEEIKIDYVNTKIGLGEKLLRDTKLGGTRADRLYWGAVKLFEYYTPGSETITTSKNWIVPRGVTSVTVKMVGGGGGGASVDSSTDGGGGYAGTYVEATYSVTAGDIIAVTIGSGGDSGYLGGNENGGAGGTTSFGAHGSATGGAGGVFAAAGTNPAFNGNGEGIVSPYNGTTYTNGILSPYGSGHRAGGQASAFANGGDIVNFTLGEWDDYESPGYGAGAGACSQGAYQYGGKGLVIVSW